MTFQTTQAIDICLFVLKMTIYGLPFSVAFPFLSHVPADYVAALKQSTESKID